MLLTLLSEPIRLIITAPSSLLFVNAISVVSRVVSWIMPTETQYFALTAPDV